MQLWLVQYLCPNRHAIAGVPYDRDETDPAAVEGVLLAAMTDMKLNPWCGLCDSRDLHFEHGKLRFKTWDEAIKGLREVEQDQLRTRQYFDTLKRESN